MTLPMEVERPSTPDNQAVYLPDEIIIQILSYIAESRHHDAKRTLASCCFLSRRWYDSAVPLLYERPVLSGRNFDLFVRTICPSKNVHVIRSPLAELVKVLDLSRLVHEGSKSTTARLIGRTKGQLEEFVAPVATFSAHCFPALSKCKHLKLLDLSLVAESPPLPDLFRTFSHLEQLQTLRLPRSSGFGVHHKPSSFGWPTHLQELCLSGGIDAHFLHGIVSFPQTLRHLTIENCPNAKSHAVTYLLKKAVQPLTNLQSLKIAHMPRISRYALDNVLILLPQLQKLSVSIDYVSEAMFDETHYHHNNYAIMAEDPTQVDPFQPSMPIKHALRTLELTASSLSHTVDDKLQPVDVLIAVSEGAIPKLRQVRVAKELEWDGHALRDDLEQLVDELQSGARDDWLARDWLFEQRGNKDEDHAKQPWKDVAGVWVFGNGYGSNSWPM